ncbi:MAG: FHA domain-containing protein, partial [Deltaproteobacteria bacterium]|nr:FHA domain-containing protein [Deltaproteobacteria bacterium]
MNGSAVLEIIEGNDAGKKFPLSQGATVVGRGADSTFVLADLSVSRKHFQIVASGDGFLMQDLGSGNGTKVNGVKLKERLLEDGDLITCGKTKIKYHDPRRRMAQARMGQTGPVGAPQQPGQRPRQPTMYQNWGGGPAGPGGPGMPPGGPGMPPGRPGMQPGRPGMPPGGPGMPPGGPGMPPGGPGMQP